MTNQRSDKFPDPTFVTKQYWLKNFKKQNSSWKMACVIKVDGKWQMKTTNHWLYQSDCL